MSVQAKNLCTNMTWTLISQGDNFVCNCTSKNCCSFSSLARHPIEPLSYPDTTAEVPVLYQVSKTSCKIILWDSMIRLLRMELLEGSQKPACNDSSQGTAVQGLVPGRYYQEELIKQQELLLKFLSQVREGNLAMKLVQENSPLVTSPRVSAKNKLSAIERNSAATLSLRMWVRRRGL